MNTVDFLRQQRGVLARLDAQARDVIAGMLDAATDLDAADGECAAELLKVAELIGRREQSDHGLLVRLLGQVDQARAARGGVKAWVATHLDVSDGRARAIAQAARRVGTIPELAEPLTSGRLGSETISVLSRTAKAVEGTRREVSATLTSTLDIAEYGGLAAAKKHVQVLEHTLDPDASQDLIARQRARSFARVIELDEGMCRFEILLDAVRATTVRSAMDLACAHWIRRRQYDGANVLPNDVRSTEQINAHAITRLAEVFHEAPAELRDADFTPPMLFSAPLQATKDDPFAVSVYGAFVPRQPLPEPADPTAHLLQYDESGHPVLLDGVKIDTDPGARLATRTQRVALEHSDRHCRFPGCSRPATWSLHAHHRTPFSKGGATTVANLVLLCSEHHTLEHQPDHGE